MVENRTLALLIVAAVVLSIGGQFYALHRMESLGPVQPVPTGYAAVATGLVNLTVLSQTDVTLSGIIDFGTGVVNTTGICNNATLHSNGTTGLNLDNCWVNQTISPNSVVANATGKFVINNSGNVNISITMDSVANLASNFIGNGTPYAYYNYTANQNNAGAIPSCQTGLQSVWSNVTSSSSMAVCTRMFWEDGKDQITVAILVRIPGDVERGYKNDNLTFTSAQN